MTAREVLVKAAGDDHWFHSVAVWRVHARDTIRITCSCRKEFDIEMSAEIKMALRNMPKSEPS